MKNVELDLKNGKLLIDGCVIAPLGLDDFISVTNQKAIKFDEVTRNADWPMYGSEVSIQNQKFWMNVSFNQKKFDSVWLSWNGGVVAKKGYDTTEKELISDKNSLSNLMKKVFQKEPEVKEYNHDVFLFDWGYISTSASLQSVMVTLGISWKEFRTYP